MDRQSNAYSSTKRSGENVFRVSPGGAQTNGRRLLAVTKQKQWPGNLQRQGRKHEKTAHEGHGRTATDHGGVRD